MQPLVGPQWQFDQNGAESGEAKISLASQVETGARALFGPGNSDQVFPKNEMYGLHGSQRIGKVGTA